MLCFVKIGQFCKSQSESVSSQKKCVALAGKTGSRHLNPKPSIKCGSRAKVREKRFVCRNQPKDGGRESCHHG
jgi:hypothetical protein